MTYSKKCLLAPPTQSSFWLIRYLDFAILVAESFRKVDDITLLKITWMWLIASDSLLKIKNKAIDASKIDDRIL